MTYLKRFNIVFCILCLSLVFAGCSKDDPDNSFGRRISKITQTADVRMIVKDAQSGAVISEETINRVLKERVFIWEGDILKKYTQYVNGELYCSYNYTYSGGKLIQVVDDVDGMVSKFFYSNRLDRIESTFPSGSQDQTVFSYDENGRVKSFDYYNSDGSSLYADEQLAKYRFTFSFKGNNVSSYTFLEYHYVDDTEPFYIKTTEFDYSAAINPLKSIYTNVLRRDPSEMYAENLYSHCRTFNTQDLIAEDTSEVIYDKDKYPVERKFNADDDYYSGGNEIITQGYIIETYEYLDQ